MNMVGKSHPTILPYFYFFHDMTLFHQTVNKIPQLQQIKKR